MNHTEVCFEALINHKTKLIYKYRVWIKQKRWLFKKKILVHESYDFNEALDICTKLIILINNYGK